MKTSDKISRKIRLIRLMAVVLIAAALIGTGMYAKYVRRVEFTGNVTFSENLAAGFEIVEHEAVRQADGSYQLGSKEILSNTYQVMPGVDIPKDPYIRIEHKSDVQAYLYIEIEDTSSAAVTYKLTNKWSKLDGCKGSNGGEVYVYADVLDETNCAGPIPVFENNLLTVSDQYDEKSDGFKINIYGYMLQKTDKTAVQGFKDSFI